MQEQESDPTQAIDPLSSGSVPMRSRLTSHVKPREWWPPLMPRLRQPKLRPGPPWRKGREDVAEGAERRARIRVDSLIPSMAMQLRGAESAADVSETERWEAPVPGLRLEGVVDSLSSEGSSLIVPWGEVLSMDWEEWFPGEMALHIRQLLPMGDTLELRYLGMLIGTDPEGQPRRIPGVLQEKIPSDKPLSPVVMQASLPPGWNQVVVPLGKGWLVARAALPEAHIRGLLNFIR